MKDIPGFPGYKITEDGKLYNPKGKLIERRDEWQGYPRARLKHESGKFVNRKIHTLVALAHLGQGKEVRHKDNDRSNFHLHNLEWGDRWSNAADRLARGSYHLPTKLVNGKALLVVGDKLYDPENKTFHEEKVASKLYPKAHRYLFQNFHPIELVHSAKKGIQRSFVNKKLYDLASKGHKPALELMKQQEKHILGSPTERLHNYLQQVGFTKKAEWTSKRNAEAHAKKHAKKMGMSEEEYIEAAKKSLNGKLALINIKNDVHKSRDSKGNVIVHKDKKVITFYPGSNKPVKVDQAGYSKVAYLRRAKKHLDDAIPAIRDWQYNQPVTSAYLKVREDDKNASIRPLSSLPPDRS